MDRPRINSEEWMVVAAVVVLMLVLTYLSHEHWISSKSVFSTVLHDVEENDNIKIVVEGAVRFPGEKTFKKGTLLRDVIEDSSPLENADLKGLPQEKVVKDGQRFKIKEKEYITVYVKGAVKIPGAIVLEKGMAVQDLMKRLALQDNADTEKLNLRKKLKEGDVIKIHIKQ